jgi:glycosyltransferase involved in cell wall biosynthesis
MNSSALRVSVAMPVYNAGRYLAQAVESILSQTLADFEFIIIDDGSTDDSRALLERYAAADPRIRLISRPNTGYCIALREALLLARAGYFARMDADDISLPKRLELQANFLDVNPACLAVGCRVVIIDPDGEELGEVHRFESHEAIDQHHLTGAGGAVITHPSAMFRTESVRAVGGYRADREPAEDLDLFLRLAETGKLAKLPDVLLKYRVHLNSVGHSRRAEQMRTILRVVNEARVRRGMPRVDSSLQEFVEPHPSVHYLNWASGALKYGNTRTARKHAITALQFAPFSKHGWYLIAGSLLPRRFVQTHGPGFKG